MGAMGGVGATGDAGVRRAAALLNGHPDFRVLRRIAIPRGRVVEGDVSDTFVGAAIDCETTGLDHRRDVVIELAVRRFRADREGRIVALDHARSWLQDPGRPLDPEVAALTGLADADLAGRRIDVAAAAALLLSCELVVAHNAGFDAGFVERAVPDAAGLRWACSVSGADWRRLGFEGRSLGWLLAQSGWFYRAHRAGDDVDALIELLRHELPDGRTVLAHVMDDANREGWLVRAEGAAYGRREALKGRGYSWSGAQGVWFREVADEVLDDERLWLAREVYDPDHRPRRAGPTVDRVTASNRYRLH